MRIAYLLILILSASFALDSDALNGKVILLDPGHGDPDNNLEYPLPTKGSMPYDDVMDLQAREDRIVHRIARTLKPKLEGYGATVYMTSGDTTLYERKNLADSIEDLDIVVSIHNNGGPSTANGVESLYYSEDDRVLCSYLNDEAVKILNSSNRGLKYRDDLTILYAEKPACLVELEFLSYQPETYWAQDEDCYEKAEKKVQEAYDVFERYCEMAYLDSSSETACKDKYRELILEENMDGEKFGQCRVDCYNQYAMDSYIKSHVQCYNGHMDYLSCTKRCDSSFPEEDLTTAFCYRSCENFVSQENPYIGEYTYCKLYTDNDCSKESVASFRYCFQSQYTDSGLNSCEESCNKLANVKSLHDMLVLGCSSKIGYNGLVRFEGKQFTSYAHLMESMEYQEAAADALLEGIAAYFQDQ